MYVHQFTKVHYSIPHFHLDFLQFYVGEIIISTNTQQIINKVDDQLSTDLQSFLVTILFSETDQLGLSTRKVYWWNYMCFLSNQTPDRGTTFFSFNTLRCYSISVFKSKPHGEMGLKFIECDPILVLQLYTFI